MRNIEMLKVKALKPYKRNARTHSAEQVDKIAASLKEFGFINPVLIDADNMIIAGHGRVQAAKVLGLEEVPCLRVEHLTEEQKRAYILADNRLAEAAGWDEGLLRLELEELQGLNFDINLTGFEFRLHSDWFDDENREKGTENLENESDEYREFVEKFEQKHTSDDCFTPPKIFDAVANYVTQRYGVEPDRMLRPFYPGGDYVNELYPPGYVVVDNPPFSIIAEIVKFYAEKKVPFFLFCPGMTGIKATENGVTFVAVGSRIIYENGANVPTSFITNLEDEAIALMSAPELYAALEVINKETIAEQHQHLKSHIYPDHIITAAIVTRWSRYGVPYKLRRDQAVLVSALDQQKETDDSIYGKGFLLSDAAAKERAEAEALAVARAAEAAAREKENDTEEWQLSARELEIVKNLGGGSSV